MAKNRTVPYANAGGNGRQAELPSFRRYVVFAPNWLGDAVMALPAIADVRRARPEATLHLAARPSVAPLFSLVPGIDGVVVLAPGSGGRRALEAGGFDLALLLPNSFQSALAARRAGIRERWGYRADFRGPLLTRSVTPGLGVHQAEYYQRLVSALGFPAGPLQPRLVLTDDARRAGIELLRGHGWDGRAPLLGLAPGAAYGGAKRWPPSSFADLAVSLARDGVRSVIVGSAADASAARDVLTAIGGTAASSPNNPSHPIDLTGTTDLPALAGVLASCRGLVTNDSGAMHFAAALGVAVTAMFGPTNERETRPLGPAAASVLIHPVWCRPCMLRECPLTHRCMRGISVDAVLEAARRTL